MCSECHRTPCVSRCPNADEPEVIGKCAHCEEPVYAYECKGSRSDAPVNFNGDIVHAECVDDYVEDFRMVG